MCSSSSREVTRDKTYMFLIIKEVTARTNIYVLSLVKEVAREKNYMFFFHSRINKRKHTHVFSH